MTTRSYAQGTTVTTSRSRDEIERTLERFGATGQIWMRDDETRKVTVAFKRQARSYKFTIALPDQSEFLWTPNSGRARTASAAKQVCDAETRRRFRSLANYLKALLDAIDTGIIEVDEALLPYMMLGSGETVYERVQQQIEAGVVDLTRRLTAGVQQ